MLATLTERIKAVVPPRLRQLSQKLRPLPKRFLCPVCNSKLSRFAPLSDHYIRELDAHQHVHSIFALETMNVLQYECTRCRAPDRNRLYALYLARRCTAKTKFVEFAPAPALSRFIRSIRTVEHRSADLYDARADDRVDLTQIPYPDASMDAFLASHILEHIPDDRKAMRELYRILKPGGWGIAMVPIQLTLDTTLEGLPIDSDADRWKYYGQHDHVRLYSKQDFVARLGGAGFTVQQLGIDFFGKDTFEKHGIHPRSVLYVVEKPSSMPT